MSKWVMPGACGLTDEAQDDWLGDAEMGGTSGGWRAGEAGVEGREELRSLHLRRRMSVVNDRANKRR
jgi:hypothetical protein